MPSEADAGSGTGADATTGADTGPGAHTGAARLADVLAEAGAGPAPTSVELAELLWLASHMKAPEAEAPATPSAHSGSGPAPDSDSAPPAFRGARNRAPSPHPPAPRTQPNPDHPEIPEPPNSRVPLHLPGTPTPADASPADTPSPNTSHTSLLAPAPPMLPHPLKLQRALRPLKRSVPAPFGQELDEAATAHRIARLGAAPQWWLPVLRPATERWLTLHLVHDTGPTMPIWRPLVRELHAALAQSGIFRTVELHRLETDGTVRRPGSQEAYADGRTVTLLISDCMGPQWRDGPAGTRWYATLRRWSARMPVAVVQPLPERLWRTTALPATTARIAAPGPAAPNSAYDVDSYAMEDLPQDVLPLPVLEASAPWLANWSALVAGGGRLPGAVGLLGAAPPPAPIDEWGRGDVEQLSPEELLLRFRSLASPEAFRLAGHLAVGRAELPVMRLVHAAIERNPQPQHLAEVILSGALIAVPGTAGSYVFRPGVRELLRRTLPRTALGRTSELTARVGALIDARAGVTAGDFRVAVPGPGDITADGEPFTSVKEESVRRMGGAPPKSAAGLVLGRYRLVRRLGRGKHVMEAEDIRSGQTVAVYPRSIGPKQHERFLDTARVLAGVRHPNVMDVRDFGVENDIAYLVTEFIEGATLAESSRLPFTAFVSVVRQIALGLGALHEQGVAHGRLSPQSLLMSPDGTVRITHFEPVQDRGNDESKDLEALGHLLEDLGVEEAPEELREFERAFRSRLDGAVRLLRSPDTDSQSRAVKLLKTTSFGASASETAPPTAFAADRYRYRLLGPVRIERGDDVLPNHSPEEQAVLCMLLLRHGEPVTHVELTEGLWGRHSPGRAGGLSTYSSGLRKILGPGILATTGSGYALSAPHHSVDVNRCEELVADAKSRHEEGDPTTARDTVQRALDLWYGDPLDGVPGPAAEATRTRLRAQRLSLYATRAELDLELGHFERAATDLDDLLRTHPEHEDFRRLHALARRNLGSIADADRPTITMEEPPFLPPAAESFAAPPDAAAPFLVDVPHVLIGFDGPLVRLYTRAKEEQATQELAALLAELRHPDAALSGEPLSPGGVPVSPLEGRSNPLDLLRAFTEHPLGADLRRRLNRIEERAVSTATATPFSDSLITTLNALGRRVAVVADNAPSAVWMYLQAHGRLTGLVSGVHGRAEELTRLMPNPDCLLRALDQLGASPSDAVLVGSSVAELTAANAIGLRFLGYTRSEPHKQRLLRAGCELTTASWAPLIQSLPNT
ncbi:SAV_2336 N-terminal domain-related protein [Streptomyces phaeochromogenes]|uniref:SAV_2336 N-terminal domain-related protein n=1 Tax=Streptomyces phaeochromogenes TaxID=1923 RepID=UPI0033F57EE5